MPELKPIGRLFLYLILIINGAKIFAQIGRPTESGDPGRRTRSTIINDSTQQIYGPRTSRTFNEEDIFFNRFRYNQIDTLIRNFHRYDYVQRSQYRYQDLGVIGTASYPVFYQSPSVIGRRSGAHVYDLYWDSDPLKYYDTKSPYSNMKVILGGLGRAITRATYSRNINERWNFGFTYRGILINKQLERSGKTDRLVRSHYYDGFTSYKSKDSTYRLFINFRRMYHRVEEFGGVSLEDDQLLSESFDINAVRTLTNAQSSDLRMNFHLYHQYQIGKGLQFYHVADRYRQGNKYTDVRTEATAGFYDFENIPTDSVYDYTKFKAFRNEVGIKGNLGKLFYNGYAAIRHYSYQNNYLRPDTLKAITHDSLLFKPVIGDEIYFGGRVFVLLDSIGQLTGKLEVMPNSGDEFNFRLEGELKSKWFEARLKQMLYYPGFIEQGYRGTFDVWNNNFDQVQSTELNGYVHYRSRILSISPGLTFTRLGKYVFYKKMTDEPDVQQVLPVQSSGSQVIASPEVRLSLTFMKHITLSGNAIYTRLLENSDDAFSVPELFVNGQLSYANIFFNGNFDFHTGVDVHWKSDYYAHGYDPAIRQFYRQDEFKSPSFPIIDIFIGAKIKRGRVFFKYHNLVQALTKEGYFPAPTYVGQRNTIDFGFDWSFYD